MVLSTPDSQHTPLLLPGGVHIKELEHARFRAVQGYGFIQTALIVSSHLDPKKKDLCRAIKSIAPPNSIEYIKRVDRRLRGHLYVRFTNSEALRKTIVMIDKLNKGLLLHVPVHVPAQVFSLKIFCLFDKQRPLHVYTLRDIPLASLTSKPHSELIDPIFRFGTNPNACISFMPGYTGSGCFDGTGTVVCEGSPMDLAKLKRHNASPGPKIDHIGLFSIYCRHCKALNCHTVFHCKKYN